MTGWLLAAILAAQGSTSLPPDPREGTFVLLQVVNTAARIPFFGEVTSTSYNWSLLTLWQEGETWRQRQEICRFDLQGRSLVARTVLPRSFARSLPVRVRTVEVAMDGRYDADLGVLAAGFDPAVGPLPGSPEDPSARDTDLDGHPGATVRMEIPVFSDVEVYLAQANHFVLHGRFEGDDRVVGTVTARQVETRVLGASNRLFTSAPQTRFLEEGSVFWLDRVPPPTTCDTLPAALALPTR